MIPTLTNMLLNLVILVRIRACHMEALDQVALEACLLEETATVEAVDTNKGMLVKIKEWETI